MWTGSRYGCESDSIGTPPVLQASRIRASVQRAIPPSARNDVSPPITIVDYGIGNVGSIQNMLKKIGVLTRKELVAITRGLDAIARRSASADHQNA